MSKQRLTSGLRDGNDDEGEPNLAEAIWPRFTAVGGVELELHPPVPLSAPRPFNPWTAS